MIDQQLLTRTDAAVFLTARGLPTAKTTLDTLAVRGYWGRKLIYTAAALGEFPEGHHGRAVLAWFRILVRRRGFRINSGAVPFALVWLLTRSARHAKV